MPGPEPRGDNRPGRLHATRRPALLTLLLAGIFVIVGGTDVPQRSQEQLDEMSTDIILGVVESRSMEETLDPLSWQVRSFEYTVRVEETIKGNLKRGDAVTVKAGTRDWVGPGPMPPSNTGHHPLPLVGELAKFHLVLDGGAVTYSVVLPNGVELAKEASIADPRRNGDPPAEATPTSAEQEVVEEATKNPFGWDVILLLLAIPLVVGGLRQKGRPRSVLLLIATIMLAGAVVIVLF